MEAGQSTEVLRKLIEAAAAEVGVPLAAAQVRQLATHFHLLLQWNQKINLTAVRDPQQIATRHFGESLFLSRLIAAPAGTVVDVGSGAGFPGLPLQVVWPQAGCVLVESNLKKATFLREVIRQAGLGGARVECVRAEDAARGPLAGACALVTMRAVAMEPSMLQSIAALLREGGVAALFAGAEDAKRLMISEQFRWSEPHPVPHGERRVILTGKRR